MKLIPPYQISSEIINVINRATKFVVIVSPYVKLQNWEIIKQEIRKAVKRGVHFKVFVRNDSDNYNSWEAFEEFNIKPKLVKNLHAKIYYNENIGVITSMNLYTSSSQNSIEFGTQYRSKEEINELKEYVKQYLLPHAVEEFPSEKELYYAKENFTDILQFELSNQLNLPVSVSWKKRTIKIYAKNQFFLSIDKVSKTAIITAIISSNESEKIEELQQKLTQNPKIQEAYLTQDKGMSGGFEAMLMRSFTSENFNYLKVYEKEEIIEVAETFINEVLQYKNKFYPIL